MITLLTPTGFRPQAWEICKSLINKQTYKGSIRWLVSYDDGHAPDMMKLNSNIQLERIPGPKLWKEGINTQRYNMDVLIQRVTNCDYVFIIEDDDWYAPEYIEHCIWLMQKYCAVGEINNKYYHLPTQQYKEWKNTGHASLCSTAMRFSHLDWLNRAVNSGELFFDLVLWRLLRADKVSAIMYEGHPNGKSCMNVGMKGLPGRMGIGGGHQPAGQGFAPDTNWQVLQSWIGDDVSIYKGLGV